MDNPDEIVINKNNLLLRDNVTILDTEAYAVLSNTYVPNDSHAFLVSLDRKMCWANFGRCWGDKGEFNLIAKQKSYQEWLLEFCPPENYFKCGIIFGVNGVCHTFTNRELLIGENDVDVREAAKSFVTTAIFGKYGYGLDELKKLITDSYNIANMKVMFPPNTLETILARIDNTLNDEVNAWQQLIEEYGKLSLIEICKEHNDVLDMLKNNVNNLLYEREKIFNYFIKSNLSRQQYEKNIHSLLITNTNNFITFLGNNNYIDENTKNETIFNLIDFFNKLFKIVDEQVNTINDSNKMDEELAKKKVLVKY